jgi:rhamnulokinase
MRPLGRSHTAPPIVAVDLGASSGRVLVGVPSDQGLAVSEIHRFANRPVTVDGHTYWDVLALFAEVRDAILRVRRQYGVWPRSVGVDAWGVDYSLLDREGRLLSNPVHYRDRRTEGMVARAAAIAPKRELFAATGNQVLALNSLIQLLSLVAHDDPILEAAETFLTIPDLFHHWLSGSRVVEFTNATTTQCFDPVRRGWASELISRFGVSTRLFPEIVQPGTILGQLLPEVVDDATAARIDVIAPATHDTASAVAAIPLDASSAFVSCGTWSLVGVAGADARLDSRTFDAGLTNEGSADGDYLTLSVQAGLWLLNEIRGQLESAGRPVGYAELLASAAAANPLTSLFDPNHPALLGFANVPAAIRGLCARSGQVVPVDTGAIVRAALESLALSFRQAIEALENATNRRIDTVRLVGGGSRNELLCQWTADATGRQVAAGPAEASAIGNLILQSVATGLASSIVEARALVAEASSVRWYDPHPSHLWEAAYERFGVIRHMQGPTS